MWINHVTDTRGLESFTPEPPEAPNQTDIRLNPSHKKKKLTDWKWSVDDGRRLRHRDRAHSSITIVNLIDVDDVRVTQSDDKHTMSVCTLMSNNITIKMPLITQTNQNVGRKIKIDNQNRFDGKQIFGGGINYAVVPSTHEIVSNVVGTRMGNRKPQNDNYFSPFAVTVND